VATAEAANALPLVFAAAVSTVRRNQLDPVRASVKLLATLLNPGDKALASAGWAHLRPALQVGVVPLPLPSSHLLCTPHKPHPPRISSAPHTPSPEWPFAVQKGLKWGQSLEHATAQMNHTL